MLSGPLPATRPCPGGVGPAATTHFCSGWASSAAAFRYCFGGAHPVAAICPCSSGSCCCRLPLFRRYTSCSRHPSQFWHCTSSGHHSVTFEHLGYVHWGEGMGTVMVLFVCSLSRRDRRVLPPVPLLFVIVIIITCLLKDCHADH